MMHELKTDKKVFRAVWDGFKRYEIRLDDREFKVGEEILLRETEYTGEEMKQGMALAYTDRHIRATIIHKLSGEYGLKDGWCILGLELKTKLEFSSMTVHQWVNSEWQEVP